MIVLGIDPGIERMGYAVMNDLDLISSGLISTEKGIQHQQRLYNIFNDLNFILAKFKPDLIATETVFFSKNIKTASKISEVRGIIQLVSAIFNINYIELSPLQIKMSLTGYGKSNKKQIEKSIQMILKINELPKPDDVVDAIAIAICGTNYFKFNQNVRERNEIKQH